MSLSGVPTSWLESSEVESEMFEVRVKSSRFPSKDQQMHTFQSRLTRVTFVAALWAAIKHRRTFRWHRKTRLRTVFQSSERLLNSLCANFCFLLMLKQTVIAKVFFFDLMSGDVKWCRNGVRMSGDH